MGKALYMVFTDTADKEFTLRLAECSDDLTPAEVSDAMDAIIATNAVATKNGDLVAKQEAYIVDTVKTVLAIA